MPVPLRQYGWFLLMMALTMDVGQTATFTVTREGRPAATLVLSSDPSPSALFAAWELQEHIRLMTGADLPLASDSDAVDGPRILVGESAATREMGLLNGDFESQEYLVAFRGIDLVLMGRDEPHEAACRSLPERSEGRHGHAFRFDGNALVEIAQSGFSDDIGTLEAWVWLMADPHPEAGTILRIEGHSPWTYHIVQVVQGTSCIQYISYDGETVHGVTSNGLSAGWHHVAGTYNADSGFLELFIDGEGVGRDSYVRTDCHDATLCIGGLPRKDCRVANAFHGRVDDVRVSTVERPAEGRGGPYQQDENTAVLLDCSEPPGKKHPPQPGWFDDHGTLNAVYDFLERFCGVRWYFPTDIGTVISEKPTLTVAGEDLWRRPAMEYRWMTATAYFLPTKHDRIPSREADLWKLRTRLGGAPFAANHSFLGYYERFLEDHPDWFAQGYEGKPPQLCYTHPGLIAQVAQDARDYFDGKGKLQGAQAMGDFFSLVPMDNGSYCKCERCQAEMDPDRDNLQFTKGTTSNYMWGFVNRVAAAVKKTHPDRWISALAYESYAHYPDRVELEPNVAMMMCLHLRNWWLPSAEQADRTVFDAWTTKEPDRPRYLWLYYNFPAFNANRQGYQCFPGYFAHTAVKQMRRAHEAGIRGIFMEHSSEFEESHLLDVPDVYVTWRLADDPTLDGDALIDEFFELFYGAASEPMRQLYLEIETAYSEPKSYPEEFRNTARFFHQNEEIAWKILGTEERMARLGGLMEQAHRTAQTDVEVRRVKLFDTGIWQYMQEGRRRYEALEALRATPPPTVAIPRVPDTNGDPDAVDWDRAALIDEWLSISGEPSDRQITARLAHDGENLYVELEEQLDTSQLICTDAICDGDDWELFFGRGRSEPYHQLVLAPDGRCAGVSRGETGKWEHNARVTSDTSSGDRWRIVLALTLDQLVPEGAEAGDTIYGNICRASSGASQLLVWSPLFSGGFHTPTRFGELRFE